MLKFLLDVGVGTRVFEFLQNEGFDAQRVSGIDHSMKDVEILRIAAQEKRMVITMDKDFGELVFRSGRPHFGVLLLRLEDATGGEKAEVVKIILEKFAEEIQGKFCVFQNGTLRTRD